jgi:hypothetical protein
MVEQPDLNQFKVLVNSHAYQLNPNIGVSYGVQSVKEFVRNHWMKAADRTYSTISQVEIHTLWEITYLLNAKFGGAVPFLMFQCALDYGQIHNKNWLDTDPFHGTGAKIKCVSLEEVCQAQRELWPDAKRSFFQFDAEHALCEFRKYQTWKIEGIPVSRRR